MPEESHPTDEAVEDTLAGKVDELPWQARVDLCRLRQANRLVSELVAFVTNVGPRTGVALEQYAIQDDDLFNQSVTGARDRALIAAYGAIAQAARGAFSPHD